MPFRRPMRLAALAAGLLLAAAAARVPAVPVAATGPESCPQESGSCPRCPAPARRAPASCTSCSPELEAVAARRVALPAPAERQRATERRKDAPATLAESGARRRHAVLGASPPAHLLLATLRN